MKRIAVVSCVALSVLAFAGPASAQSDSQMCANGFPAWANEAFTTRTQGNFRCDPVVKSKKAAPQAKVVAPATAPASAPKAAPQPKIAAKPVEPAPKSDETSTASTGAAPASTSTAAPATKAESGEKTTAGTSKPQCRRYLASTGQTVEVPCS